MNRLKYLIILFPFFLQAQQLDETYLDSLPDDIKEDILKKSEIKNQKSKENYRPSQYSSKYEIEEELIKLKTRLESDLEELEKRLAKDQLVTAENKLELYGSNFFTTFQTTFMPINEPNPGSSYILDSGDVLTIQLIGQNDYIENFPIRSDGTINLPKIGQIVIAGHTLEKATELIRSKVSNTFIATDAFVSVEKFRDVSVLVAGNANKPGVYTLNGNSNMLHALNVAGGINEYGSYREIKLIRNNKTIERLDIYDLLIDGNFSNSAKLQSGDVIFVEMRKTVIAINGAVKRPALYELTENQKLDSVIRYSGGVSMRADSENIYLERVLDGSIKSLPIRNISQFEDIDPVDGDLIYIREYPFREASILGAVLKPGTYLMAEGETLDDLIMKAGGYTDSAYPFGAIYENEDAKLVNKKANEVLYNEFLDNIIAMSQQSVGEKFDITPIISLIKELQGSEPNGRIVVDLVNDSGQSQNIKIGDTLLIPEMTNVVYVYGETPNEGAVMYYPNEGVDYFIKKSGGLKKYADSQSIYVLHPNGETDRYSSKRNVFESKPNSQVKVYPGSVIYIPRKLDDQAARRLATQAYVSILGNLGIALASLSTINNN